MATVNPLGLYHLSMFGELHGQTTQNVFHFQTRASSIGSSYAFEATQLINDFETNVLPKVKAFCCDDWAVKTLLVTTLIPKSVVLVEKRIATGAGVQSDDSLPSFCAGLLSLRTGVGGRSGHGRLYIPGVPENLSSASRTEGSLLTILSDIGAVLLNRYSNSGGFSYARYGVYSRKLGVTRSAGPPPTLNFSHAGFFPVTEIIARPEIATMRKRKLSHGI